MNKTQRTPPSQPAPKAKEPEKVQLSVPLVDGLLQYLLTRPIGEAGQLFSALQQELAQQAKG